MIWLFSSNQLVAALLLLLRLLLRLGLRLWLRLLPFSSLLFPSFSLCAQHTPRPTLCSNPTSSPRPVPHILTRQVDTMLSQLETRFEEFSEQVQ